jgi:hypothetical protein
VIDRNKVVVWMHKCMLTGYEWLAEYIALVAESCRAHCELPDSLETAVIDAIRQLAASVKMQPLSKASIQRILFECMEYGAFVMEIPESAREVPFPIAPSGKEAEERASNKRRELLQLQYGPALSLLRTRRTVEVLKRGEILAHAACELEGRFHWVPAGPEQGDNRKGFPKERWSQTTTEAGVEDHPEKRDDFAIWLNRGGKEPGAAAYMNCWEAVMFSACKADLVSVQWLRIAHAKATLAMRGGGDYYQPLMAALGMPGATPIVPEIGLMPSPGDIIFVHGNHHVAVCVEVDEAPGLDGITVMSLHSLPADGFLRIPLLQFGGAVSGITFASCPF